MFTIRKRHLRRKRFFLQEKEIFAIFNGSNLKASKITKIKISLKNAKLYSVPLYLKPPKIGLGYPIIMVIYERLEDLQTNLSEIKQKIDCIGVSINKKWYPVEIFEKKNVTNLNNKMLALLLTKTKN